MLCMSSYGPRRAWDTEDEPTECPVCGDHVMEKGWAKQTRERWCVSPSCTWEDYDEADFEAMYERYRYA